MKRPLIIGNWKAYIAVPKEAATFARALRKAARSYRGVDAAVAPSFVLVPAVAAALKGSSVRIGVQTVSIFEEGPHTGEVTAAMAKAAGATFSLIGHSERRARGEKSADTHTQRISAARSGLMPVLCVGESERTPDGSHFAVIADQLRIALAGASPTSKLVVAYEPVWAIGKSAHDAMKPQELRETAIFIKKTLAEILGRKAGVSIPILYGGSVEAENARVLLEEGGVSGFLVGHASAELESFIEILKSVRDASGKS